MEQKNKANMRFLLQTAVCVYLLYMAVKLVSLRESDPTLPPAVCCIAGVLFAAAAVVFGVYSWRQYQKRLKEISSDEQDAEN